MLPAAGTASGSRRIGSTTSLNKKTTIKLRHREKKRELGLAGRGGFGQAHRVTCPLGNLPLPSLGFAANDPLPRSEASTASTLGMRWSYQPVGVQPLASPYISEATIAPSTPWSTTSNALAFRAPTANDGLYLLLDRRAACGDLVRVREDAGHRARLLEAYTRRTALADRGQHFRQYKTMTRSTCKGERLESSIRVLDKIQFNRS